jgi:hypothetical protein
MKNLFFVLYALSISTSAFAQGSPDDILSFEEDSVVVDIQKYCVFGSNNTCDLAPLGLAVKIVGSGVKGVNIYQNYTITSEIPVRKLELTCGVSGSTYYCGAWNGNAFTGGTATGVAGARPVRDFGSPGITTVMVNSQFTDVLHQLRRLHLNNGVPTFLNAGLTSATSILRASYKGVQRNLENFRVEIARSHRGHLDRFSEALREGIALADTKNPQGKYVYSIVDWRVQENARLIVVFGTVLNELLTDYDDVARLKNSITAMRTLVDQLRDAYGWERGLAGTVSKASSSLIEVVRLELQELASIKMAMGSTDFQIYLDMLRVTRTLQAKVDAARSGDMRAQREIFDMVDLWNGKLWQDEMGRLMNAGPDFKNLVIPKLSMLLYAIESIADLSEQNFIIPDRANLGKP